MLTPFGRVEVGRADFDWSRKIYLSEDFAETWHKVEKFRDRIGAKRPHNLASRVVIEEQVDTHGSRPREKTDESDSVAYALTVPL